MNNNARAIEIFRLRNLTDNAVAFIEEEHHLLEGLESFDPFTSGRTYVETTRRVFDAVLSRLDIDEFVDMAAAASSAETDAQVEFVERSARRSAKALEAKLKRAV